MKKEIKSKKRPKAGDAGAVVEKEKASSQPKKVGSDEISVKKRKRLEKEKEKASLQPEKMGSRTDEIFAEKKRKRLEEEKASPQPKRKKGDEIDDIFAVSKRKKLENEKKSEGGKPTKAVASKAKSLEKQKGKSRNSSSVGTSQTRKKTVDGLTVYTEAELGLGKPDSGGTGLCPFDCSCCF